MLNDECKWYVRNILVKDIEYRMYRFIDSYRLQLRFGTVNSQGHGAVLSVIHRTPEELVYMG